MRLGLISLLALLVSACGGCPAGMERDGDRCVPVGDAGLDGAVDTNVADTETPVCGPCVGTQVCDEALERCVDCLNDEGCADSGGVCVDGACVECRDGAHCVDRAPACRAGVCTACPDAGDCDGPETARAARAQMCACIVEREPDFAGVYEGADTPYESVQATYCHGQPVGSVPGREAEIFVSIAEGRLGWDFEVFASCGQAAWRFDPRRAAIAMVPDGGICHTSVECTGGSCEGTCPGTCANIRGGSCSLGCGSLACTPSGCDDPPELGEDCINGECAPNLWCSGTCMPPSPGAFPCDDDDCGAGFWCDTGMGGCMPRGAVTTACFDATQCEPALLCLDGACAAPRIVGTGCTATAQCARGARCADGVCKSVGTQGDACDEMRVCAFGLVCDDGTCRTLPALGEACEEATGCLRGTCVSGVCADAPPDSPCPYPSEPPDFRWVEALDTCGESLTCVEVSAGTFRCRPAVAPGLSCAVDLCDVGLECRSNTCQPRDCF